MARITGEEVSKRFGEVTAVDDVTLALGDGSYTVLLGPSGCGKTTTLNLIAGLEDVSAGRIFFDDEEVQDRPPHKRDVAMVFQSYALYPNRTVRDNIAFPRRMGKIDRREIANRVAEVAAKLEIAGLLDRFPRALSGGQQRVALARAIVRRPRVFLLDEPLSNLDAKLRTDMRFALKALQRQLHATFVHVTHDQAEAMSLADTLVVMNAGRVQQASTPLTVHRAPANLFVARFVGVPAMNLIDGEIASGAFRSPGWEIPVRGMVASGPMILGIRCEDLTFAAGADGVAGRVQLVEQLGADALVAVATESGAVVVRAHPDTWLQPGDTVRIGVNTRRAHLFDPQTGLRLGAASNDGERSPDGTGLRAPLTAALGSAPRAEAADARN